MQTQHRKLGAGVWNKLDLMTQLAHIGGEVARTIRWKNLNNRPYEKLAFERALELVDLTINCYKNKSRLRELARMREVLVDYFLCDNIYKSSDKLWQSYFYYFAYAASLKRVNK